MSQRPIQPLMERVRSRTMIFGENLLALLVLAIGAALAFGNLMALIRPRSQEDIGEDELERPPLGRSLIMIAVGLVAAIWALASLATADDSPVDTANAHHALHGLHTSERTDL